MVRWMASGIATAAPAKLGMPYARRTPSGTGPEGTASGRTEPGLASAGSIGRSGSAIRERVYRAARPGIQ
jgi:hypothetical protein